MEELRKCPFCGGEAELQKEFDFGASYWVECKKCEISTVNYYTKKEAIEAWNRRVKR